MAAASSHLLLNILSISLLLLFSFTSPTLSSSSSSSSSSGSSTLYAEKNNVDSAIARINQTVSATVKLAKFLQTQQKKYRDPYDTSALSDCRELLLDSKGLMKDSVKALKKYKKDGKQSHVSDAQTWLSAALTYVDTCYDEIKESSSEGLKEAVAEKMEDVEQLMGVSLGLVNDLRA